MKAFFKFGLKYGSGLILKQWDYHVQMLARFSENSEAASVVEVLCWALGICTKVTSHCGTQSLERGTGPPKVTTEIAHEVFLWDS